MVIDFKRLNAVTISDTYPIPDITSTLSSLGEAKLFTILDGIRHTQNGIFYPERDI